MTDAPNAVAITAIPGTFLVEITDDGSTYFNLFPKSFEAWVNQPFVPPSSAVHSYEETPPADVLAVVNAKRFAVGEDTSDTVTVTRGSFKNDRALALMATWQFEDLVDVMAFLKKEGLELTGHYTGLFY